jgi:hypothetical protein
VHGGWNFEERNEEMRAFWCNAKEGFGTRL